MVAERVSQGPYLLADLSHKDAGLKHAYVEVARAKRHLYNPELGLEDVIALAEQVNQSVHESLPNANLVPRSIDSETVLGLADIVGSSKGGLIIMRHGVQSIPDQERQQLVDPLRKIRLMQMPYNYDDPATAQSVAEASSLAIILMHMSKVNDISVEIKTSANRRAAEIGAVLSVSNQFNVSVDDRLTCVNYPTDKTDEELDLLLGSENKGALTWERQRIDGVCGEGTYDSISANIRSLINEYRDKPQLTVCVTHTPQTNASDILAHDTPVRMPELGMRIFAGTTTERFPHNIFRP